MDKPNDRINHLEGLLRNVESFLKPTVYHTFQLQLAGVNSTSSYADKAGCSPECYCDDNSGFCVFVCNTHQIQCCSDNCSCDMNF